jgi:hypothetical protein
LIEDHAKKYNSYDTTIIYDYREHPDVISGRCDNCGSARFSNSIKDHNLVRECKECGMKKSI